MARLAFDTPGTELAQQFCCAKKGDNMKRLYALVAVVSALGFVWLGVGNAQAGATAKTTGSIQMSGPVQYASFDAFASTPVKGSISYTNFEFPVTGSGVWVPSVFNMGFAVDPSTNVTATYAMTVKSFTPASPTSVTFTGTGDCGCGWISTFDGTISSSALTLAMTEINAGDPAETYALTASGTIASDGSVAGTWSDNYGIGRTGTFVIADIGYEVFHYVAPMAHVIVSGSDAYFDFAIPAGVPLAGTVVYVHVHDGGSPGAGNDTWSHGTSPDALTNYPIVSGNLTVFA
jgi:hypothetical protein